MKNPYILSALLFLLLTASRCNPEEVVTDNMKCNEIGKVVDYTGLDGCGLVIEMLDGTKLEPVSWPSDVPPEDGTSISFSYTVLDQVSICMVGKVVSVDCLDILEIENDDCPAAIIGEYADAPKPDFNLMSYEQVGNELKLKVSFSGCDIDRNFKLLLSKFEMKSYPPQRNAVLSFSEQLCEAYFTKELCFDISTLTQTTYLNLQVGEKVEKIKIER